MWLLYSCNTNHAMISTQQAAAAAAAAYTRPQVVQLLLLRVQI
jgi:hypothetical protein